MLYESGLVISIENDIALVNTKARHTCSSCKAESSCGAGVLERYFGGGLFVSSIQNTLNAQPGDEVVIAISETKVTQASFIAYLLPLLGLIVGSISGHFIFYQEIFSIILGAVGFGSGFIIIKVYHQKLVKSHRYIPQMISKKTLRSSPSLKESFDVKNL